MRFGQQHPELAVDTVSGGQSLELRRGDADVAVRVGPIRDEELIARRLGEVGWSLYATPRYLDAHPAPTQLHELAGHDVIVYGADLAL